MDTRADITKVFLLLLLFLTYLISVCKDVMVRAT